MTTKCSPKPDGHIRFITDHPSHKTPYCLAYLLQALCIYFVNDAPFSIRVRKYLQSHTPGTICRNFFLYWLPLRNLMRLQRWLYKSYSRKELKSCGVSRKAKGEEILHLSVWCISIYYVSRMCIFCIYRESVYKNYVKNCIFIKLFAWTAWDSIKIQYNITFTRRHCRIHKLRLIFTVYRRVGSYSGYIWGGFIYHFTTLEPG